MSGISLLLLEDNMDDVEIIHDALSQVQANFHVTRVGTLKEALDELSAGDFDLLLVDLGLPDSSGLETLKRVAQAAPNSPCIVLTGMEDESQALKAVQMGAEDYLFKSDLSSDLLVRSVRYAIERKRLQGELSAVRLNEQLDREQRLFNISSVSATASLYGVTSLKDSLPENFEALVAEFEQALEIAEERRVYQTEASYSDKLRGMAEELVYLRGGPRDVVELHTVALERMSRNQTLTKQRLFMEEGRFIALELMGYLAGIYRNYTLGVPLDSSKTN